MEWNIATLIPNIDVEVGEPKNADAQYKLVS